MRTSLFCLEFGHNGANRSRTIYVSSVTTSTLVFSNNDLLGLVTVEMEFELNPSVLTLLTTLGGVGTFCWGVIQFILARRSESRSREFEAYHRLIKDLVSPESGGGVMYLDRQAAIVFELRHFPRYREFTARTLEGLRKTWAAKPEAPALQRLLKEIDLTLEAL